MAQLGGESRRPLGKADEPRKSYESSSWRQEYAGKNKFWRVSGAEPCVFTCFFLLMFPKPSVFAVALARFGLAAAQWIAAQAADFSRKACKKLGFGNMSKKKHVKSQGSAPGTRQDLVFFLHILVAKKSFHKTFLVHLPFRGASWTPPPAGPEIVRLVLKLE